MKAGALLFFSLDTQMMTVIMFTLALSPFAVRVYQLKKLEKAHDKWIDEMYEIAADVECDRYVPGLQRKLHDLQRRAKKLTGEDFEPLGDPLLN